MQGVLLVEHEVLWLDVSVRDLPLVQVDKSREELLHDVLGRVLIQALLVDDVLEKLASFAVLENQEADVHPVPDLVQFDDVRMVKVLQDLDFVHESLQIFEVILLNRLDSELLLCFTILS